MAMGKMREYINMEHVNICHYLILQINVGNAAESVKPIEEEAKEEADRLSATSSPSKE